MKRSEALLKLKEKWKLGLMRAIRAESDIDSLIDDLLKFIQDDLRMSPEDWDCSTYGYNEGWITPPEWEPEDETTQTSNP